MTSDLTSELLQMLHEVYYGDAYLTYGISPMGSNGKTMPHKKFAKLTSEQVDASWDFSSRHRSHKVAKLMVKTEKHIRGNRITTNLRVGRSNRSGCTILSAGYSLFEASHDTLKLGEVFRQFTEINSKTCRNLAKVGFA